MTPPLRAVLVRVVPIEARRALRKTWSRRFPSTIAVGAGQGLRFDPGPSNPEYGRGDNELPVQDAFVRLIRPGDVVFDIGSNVGFFAVIGAALVGPAGTVVAFEPVPANAALVRRNAALNRFGQIRVVEKAVSDTAGTGEFLLAEYSGGGALAAAPPPDVAGSMAIEVITIDGAIASGELPTPSLVKIDVEGVELEVLRGMEQTLRRAQPIVIYEIDDGTREGFARKRQACEDYVRSLGYEVTRLGDSYAGEWLVGHFVARPSSPASSA